MSNHVRARTSTSHRPPPLVAPSAAAGVSQALRFTTWIGLLATAHLALTAAGHVLPAPGLETDLLAWLQRGDPVLTAFSLVRLVALGVAWYLTALTALTVVARASRVPGLIRTVDRLALPVVRRALQHAVGTGLAVAIAGGTVPLVLGGGPALADPLPPVVTMEAIDDATSTTVPARDPSVQMVLLDELPQSPGDGSLPSPPEAPAPAPAEDAPPVMRSDAPDPVTSLPSAAEQSTPDATRPGPHTAGPPQTGAATTGARPTPDDRAEAGGSDPVAPAPVESHAGTTAPTMRETGDTAPATADGSRAADGGATGAAQAGPGPDAVPSTPPAATIDAADTAGPVAPATWTVQAGDHLWHIAEVTVQHGRAHAASDAEVATYWHALIDANCDRLVAAGNPDLIVPGQQFLLPSVTAAEAVPAS